MNVDRLLAHYERIADTPDAVSRLRRFILDLAVRGKLVEQDPNDEPASGLLKRIAAAKVRLVKTGEIRKPRELSNEEALVEPFEIPTLWRWCRLDTIGAIIGGGTPSAALADNFAESWQGVPWLTPADLGGHSGLYIERGSRDLSQKGLRSSSATLMPAGTVLFSSRAPIGYVSIAANPISTNQGFKSIVPYVRECSRFIAIAMQTFAPEINANAPGTTFREVSGKIVAGQPFPLPPLTEQHRIVVKVDELMTLCDRLEKARANREAARDRLSASSLARLDAPDPDPMVFRNHAAFALENLTPLTTRRDQIKALRQTILNLAVRGKLVEQDPNDEPASELLKRIAKEKEGESKKTKPTISLTSSIARCDVPSGWAITDLQSVCASITDGDHLPPPKTESGVPFLVIGNVRGQTIEFAGSRFVSPEYYEALNPIRRPRSGDLLYTLVGSYGIPVVVRDNQPFCVQRHIGILRPSNFIDVGFLALAMESRLVFEQATTCATGIAQKTVPLSGLRRLLILLPPLAEQHRIVAKVDALMALCDRLETSLTIADDTRCRLLGALLIKALEHGGSHVSEQAERAAAHGWSVSET